MDNTKWKLIVVSVDCKAKLESMKKHPRAPYHEVIDNLIDFFEKNQNNFQETHIVSFDKTVEEANKIYRETQEDDPKKP